MRHFLQHKTLVFKDAHGTQLSASLQSHVYLLTFTFQVMMKILPGDNCSDSDKLTTKSRRAHMRFTPTQIQMLEQQFQEQHYLLPADRKILAMALRMTERQVKTWFQNKRAQYKRTRPLIRNPIYHNFRAGMGRQIAPFYSGAAISHLTFSDISNMCIHAYPTSPTFLPPVIVYHPPTSVAGSR